MQACVAAAAGVRSTGAGVRSTAAALLVGSSSSTGVCGQTSNTDLYRIYQGPNVFFHSSLTDQTPTPILIDLSSHNHP